MHQGYVVRKDELAWNCGRARYRSLTAAAQIPQGGPAHHLLPWHSGGEGSVIDSRDAEIVERGLLCPAKAEACNRCRMPKTSEDYALAVVGW